LLGRQANHLELSQNYIKNEIANPPERSNAGSSIAVCVRRLTQQPKTLMRSLWIREDAVYELGPIVLRCRNRRRSSAWLAVGGSPLMLYVMPPLTALFLSFPLIGIAVWQGVPPPILKHAVWGPILGAWFGACCIGTYWYYFTAPMADVLVLHEKGIRYRRRFVRFDDLTKIRPGLTDPWIVEFANRISRSAGKRWFTAFAADRIAEAARRASVTLHFKERRPVALRSVLVGHDVHDLERFFSTIAARQPALIDHDDLAAIEGVLSGQSA
jgi:hypothetical protein